jgi:hypothetical protein
MNEYPSKNTNAPEKLMSKDEYLNAVDWKFSADAERGQHGSFHWIMPKYHHLFNEIIPPPSNPYRILITDWDGGDDNTARLYAEVPGWSAIEQFAISELLTGDFPEIRNGADTAFVCLEESVTDNDIRAALPYASEFPRDERENSWKFLEQLKPYLYVHWSQLEYYASENKQLLDLLQSPEVLAKAEAHELAWAKAQRKAKWENFGADPSAERCAEQGCDNPRIRLAALCFMHQQIKFGG